MDISLLDVIDAGLPSRSGLTTIIVILVTVFSEAAVMILMKYHRFKTALLHSFIVNIASMAAGLVLIEAVVSLFRSNAPGNILILLALSILIEFVILYFLNKKLPVKKTIWVTVVMNLVSYALYFLIIAMI